MLTPMGSASRGSARRLPRSLGSFDAVLIGLGAMLGAGIFAALAPAAAAAGSALLLGLAVAAMVAYCNARSSARLAVRFPAAGGTYVYATECLNQFWGTLAGWGFVVGKTASCAAMALTVGHYGWPDHAHAVATATVLAITVVNYLGVQKSAWLNRAIVVLVLMVLAAVVCFALGSETADHTNLVLHPPVSAAGVLQSAGLLFFAFAGYARIATLAEEVRDPTRVIPRAIAVALGITLAVYVVVAVAALSVLGATELSSSDAPLVDSVRAAGAAWLVPVVAVAAVAAAVGSLLALLLGVSRTTLAMARDAQLPTALAVVHPRFQVPHRAEVTVGIIVAVLAATVDLRSAIGFSSFTVLVYYGITNASAYTLGGVDGRSARVVAVLGGLGCLTLACTLPTDSIVAGALVLAVGAVGYLARRRARG